MYFPSLIANDLLHFADSKEATSHGTRQILEYCEAQHEFGSQRTLGSTDITGDMA